MENTFKQYGYLFFNPETDLLAKAKDGKFTYLSAAWEKYLGWTLEELLQMSWQDLVHPDDWKDTEAVGMKILKTGSSQDFVNRYITKNREIRWFKWRSVKNPENPEEVCCIGVDMTNLYQKDHAHRVSQEQAKIGNWHFYKTSRSFYWSEQIYNIYEIPHGTELGFVRNNKFHNEHNWNKMAQAFTACLEKGVHSSEEIELITLTGKNKWISCWWLPIKVNEDIIGIEGLIQDITERKQKELALKETDDRYEVVLSGINAGIWDWSDINDEPQYWSPKLYQILKLDPKVVTPSVEFAKSIVHPEDFEEVAGAITNLVEYNVHYMIEYRVLCGDGQYKWVQSSAVSLKDENGVTYRIIGTVIDIHQKKITEAHLEEEKQKSIQASKLATLGEMAAGLAHEVNNPLTIIFGYIRVLEEELSSKNLNREQTTKFLNLIKSAAERAAKIVVSLKEFARDGSQDPFEDYSASEIMTMVMELSRERFKKNDIRLEIEMSSDPLIHCRKTEISQVILNLLFNSFDAIQEFNQKWVKIYVGKVKGKALISITDCGHGLVPEVAEKIFTPFFTTKKMGQGTGLGLSISQRIIVNHGGEIFYDSSSLNTKFVIKLPLYYELV